MVELALVFLLLVSGGIFWLAASSGSSGGDGDDRGGGDGFLGGRRPALVPIPVRSARNASRPNR